MVLTCSGSAISTNAFWLSSALIMNGLAPALSRWPEVIRVCDGQGRTPHRNPATDAVKITVNSLQVTGARAYPEAELLALTGFMPGSELTLADLNAMALKITDRYRSDGYFVAQAYLPAQEIQNGAVTIAVIEGQYGAVTVRNQSTLSDGLIQSQLEGLNSGDPIVIEPIERRLLLLSDIPGVKVSSTLAPGVSVGASDLIVDVVPGDRITGSIDADNAGT